MLPGVLPYGETTREGVPVSLTAVPVFDCRFPEKLRRPVESESRGEGEQRWGGWVWGAPQQQAASCILFCVTFLILNLF